MRPQPETYSPLPPPAAPGSTTTHPSSLNTAYTLSLLGEYAHTLSSLPLDLARHFGDLRELDAVLSSSLNSLTQKITRLTALIESGPADAQASREERLWALCEIADECNRLKPGGEDKIRVACQAADALKMHALHLATLAEHAPGGEYDAAAVLSRRTTYPHVATRTYVVPNSGIYGEQRSKRRAAAAAGQLATQNQAAQAAAVAAQTQQDYPTPKRRKTGREEDEMAYGRSPRKDKATDRPRNGARPKKVERAPSPAESLVSIASHLPTARPAQAARAGSNTSVARPRRDGAAANNDHRTTAANGHHHAQQEPNWTILEGPGVGASVHAARNVNASGGHSSTSVGGMNGNSTNDMAVDDDGDDGGVVEDGDDGRMYCVCRGPSYGDMVGCDDDNCEREWFHMSCVGLTSAPEGSWFCEECTARRNAAKRGSRGGARRRTNNRARDK